MARKVVTEERREDIVKGLYRCLIRKSYHETTIKDIAAETPCSYGIIHYHFRSKEDILFALISYLLKFHYSEYQKMSSSQNPEWSPEKKLEELFRYISENITLNRELNTVFLKIVSISLDNESIRDRIRELYHNWFRMLKSTHLIDEDKTKALHKSISLIALHEGLSLFSVILDQKQMKEFDITSAFRKITE